MPSASDLDTELDRLRQNIAHHLATGSPRSADAGRESLARLGAWLEGGARQAACGGGNAEHQPLLADLLELLSRQALAASHDDARRIARVLEALSHSADSGLGPLLRARIVALAEAWRARERWAGDLAQREGRDNPG